MAGSEATRCAMQPGTFRIVERCLSKSNESVGVVKDGLRGDILLTSHAKLFAMVRCGRGSMDCQTNVVVGHSPMIGGGGSDRPIRNPFPKRAPRS
jgi:hypothetical protein